MCLMTECVMVVSDYDIPVLKCHHIFPSPLLPFQSHYLIAIHVSGLVCFLFPSSNYSVYFFKVSITIPFQVHFYISQILYHFLFSSSNIILEFLSQCLISGFGVVCCHGYCFSYLPTGGSPLPVKR